MSEWWTYRPSDFLMFSPAVYRRLFELYNADLWPLHVLAAAITLAFVVAIARQRPIRTALAGSVLAASWLGVAWAFHWQRYASVNWAAAYFASAFAIEGALLAFWAVARRRRALMARNDVPARFALAALVVALLYPVMAIVAGRSLQQAEVPGLAPDPTAIATLALVALERGKLAWLLRAIPWAWCVVNGLLLEAMHAPEAWLLFAAAVGTLIAGVAHRDADKR